MYLSNLKLWNFRKYGTNKEYNLKKDTPDLNLDFQKNLNVLIGQNDAGKTAIIDAIKLVLKTHSYEYIKVDNFDFHNEQKRFRIELLFSNLSDEEAKNFVEWLGYKDNNIYLRLIYDVSRNDERIFPSEVKAGMDEDGSQLTAEAREYLKVTYLKPLRDARTELIAKKNSRVSQILLGDDAFKGKDDSHYLIEYFNDFNKIIENYFEGKKFQSKEDKELIFVKNEDMLGKSLKDKIENYIKDFYEPSKEIEFEITGNKLREILEKISIFIKDEKNLGLGTLNRLFMATELLHLGKENYYGLKLGLIEELEAHLHPQAQMKVIERLQEEKNKQLILTTHSPNLASKVKLDNLIICNKNKAYSLTENKTALKSTDYKFLERFLDTTKANLFFAKGVILVEGWAEEILIPVLAKKIGYNLTKKQVSVVNVGNTAFLRYVNIFKRQDLKGDIGVKISVITDLDLRPVKYATEKNISPDRYKENNIETQFNVNDVKKKKKESFESVAISNIKAFISPHWTLEYCLAKSKNLRKLFFKAVLEAHKEQKENDCIQETTLDNYRKSVSDYNTAFDNWSKSEDDIAFDIYWQILGELKFSNNAKEKISKSIIAQRFAEILEDDSNKINFEAVKKDSNIEYLCEAIKHACS